MKVNQLFDIARIADQLVRGVMSIGLSISGPHCKTNPLSWPGPPPITTTAKPCRGVGDLALVLLVFDFSSRLETNGGP